MAKDCLPLAMQEVVSFSPGILATIDHIKENVPSDRRKQKIAIVTAQKTLTPNRSLLPSSRHH
jgi:hypothetical protein